MNLAVRCCASGIVGTSHRSKVKESVAKTVRSRDRPEVPPFEEDHNVAEDHEELHVV